MASVQAAKPAELRHDAIHPCHGSQGTAHHAVAQPKHEKPQHKAGRHENGHGNFFQCFKAKVEKIKKDIEHRFDSDSSSDSDDDKASAGGHKRKEKRHTKKTPAANKN